MPPEDANLLELASCCSLALFAASHSLRVHIPISRVAAALHAKPRGSHAHIYSWTWHTDACLQEARRSQAIWMFSESWKDSSSTAHFNPEDWQMPSASNVLNSLSSSCRRKLSATTVGCLVAGCSQKAVCARPTGRHESFGMGDDVLISHKVARFVLLRTFTHGILLHPNLVAARFTSRLFSAVRSGRGAEGVRILLVAAMQSFTEQLVLQPRIARLALACKLADNPMISTGGGRKALAPG